MKPFRWICKHHNVDLVPGGHVAGCGIECWPGISYDYETKIWTLDSSELCCPALEDDATDEQFEACGNSWATEEVE